MRPVTGLDPPPPTATCNAPSPPAPSPTLGLVVLQPAIAIPPAASLTCALTATNHLLLDPDAEEEQVSGRCPGIGTTAPTPPRCARGLGVAVWLYGAVMQWQHAVSGRAGGPVQHTHTHMHGTMRYGTCGEAGLVVGGVSCMAWGI